MGTIGSGASVTGRVVGRSNQPQAGVPVQVQGPLGTTHVFTDLNSNWSLYNVQPGTYAVRPAGNASSQSPAVQFTVKESGFFGKLSGSSDTKFSAPEIKLDSK
jgi:hypothetical protein